MELKRLKGRQRSRRRSARCDLAIQKQLEKPSIDSRQVALKMSENTKNLVSEEETHDAPKPITTTADKTSTGEGRSTSLPYPTTAKRRRRAKTISSRIIELL
ncbi:hypothetical protein PIB30_058039 [Stylosanthes scabra]|uniref:Uncharacterized protein n=1 Tax=Stylosanthes scabra TaxID=79078 RepID=A0ABU6VID8_9FABA|nr:hypothetical protein [Stylosanthes scabra]